MKKAFALLGVVCLGSFAVVSCTSLLGDFSKSSGVSADGSMGDDTGGTGTGGNEGGGTSSSGGRDGNSSGAANGTACQSGAACASGYCADGVCCNNACNGPCESCNATGSPGTCTGYAMNTDPEKECLSVSEKIALEAGTMDAAGEGGGDDGGGEAGGDGGVEGGHDGGVADGGSPKDAAGDGPSDAGSDAPVYNFPDGGVTSNDMVCAGSCNGMGGNGKGACTYPGPTTTCGTAWCNQSSQSGQFTCDTQGGCGITTTDCGKYACENKACVSTCSATTDCADSDYCNASASPPVCTPKLGDGLACTLPTECKSGACTNVGGSGPATICCSSACDTVPGATCFKPGHIGQCECSVDCGDAGSCMLWYRDYDKDGYGDQSGTLANGNAMVGCSGQTPPTGWVTDHSDCDDSNGPYAAQVNPAQTGFFGYGDSKNLNNPYDWNCDGKLEKSVPEYPGASCEFCSGSGAPLTCSMAYTCGAAGDQASFGCGLARRILCFGFPPRCSFISYCSDYPVTGFTQTVPCGQYQNTTTCSTCTAAGGYPQAGTPTSTQQQCQ
jgi:hypothetical protein